MRVCAWGKCDREFEPSRHNQIYCCEDHMQRAARESILRRYHERKSVKAGAKRLCQCGTPLSRYNFSKVCSKCDHIKTKEMTNGQIDTILEGINEFNNNRNGN